MMLRTLVFVFAWWEVTMLARGRSNAAEAHATREQSFGINEKLGYWDDMIDREWVLRSP